MPQIGVDIGNYAFNAIAGTITISGVSLTDIEQFAPIVNGNDGLVIFNPATIGSFGTLAGNVLTLNFDTAAMSDTDKLYICVNLPSNDDNVGVLNAADDRINPSTEEKQDNIASLITSLSANDFATEVTLAAVLAKIITAPSTEAKQDAANALLTSLDGKDFSTETTLASLLTAFNTEDFASETTLSALLAAFNAEDFATQTTLAALLVAFNTEDFATQTTLSSLLTAFNAEDFASETKLEAVRALLFSLDGKDYATQTTLATLATEAKLEAVRVLLASLDGKDYATQTTLSALLAAFSVEDFATQTTLSSLLTAFNAEDFASETKLEAVRALIASLDGKDYATQTTLATLATEAKLEAVRALISSLDGKDFATQTTLSALLAAFNAEDFASETTLSTLKSKFVKDTIITDVEIDTATPANNEPLPTALYNDKGLQGTPSNPLNTAIRDASTDSRMIVDQNGAAKFGEAIILAGDVLYGQPLSTLLWKSLSINGGTTVGGSGEQILQTNTTANGEVILQSFKRSRFMISQFNISHFGLQLNASMLSDPNTIVEWGSVDFISDANILNASANGVFFRVVGHATTPVWSIVSIKNGVETEDFQNSWNGNNADIFNASPPLSVYEIQYNAGTAIFFQGQSFIHRVTRPTPYAAVYNFPVALRIRNINGNTTNRTIGSRAAGSYRLGEERGETIPRTFTSSQLIKSGSGYIATAGLSRTGSAGGNGTLLVYDGIDATGILIGRLDVGGDAFQSISLDGTFTDGLFIDIAGSGTNTANISFE